MRRHSRARRGHAAVLGAMLIVLVTAPAQARPLRTTGGSDLDFSAGPLERIGYVEAIEPASHHDEEYEVLFPIARGSDLDPATGRGTIRHGGAMFMGRGRRKVKLSQLVFRSTPERTVLTAKISSFCRLVRRGGRRVRRCVGPKRIELARLLKVRYAPPYENRIGIESEVSLTRFAARALNVRLATRAFKGDARMGTFGVSAYYF